MARDRSLRLTFTAVTGATNLSDLRTGLGSQTAVIAQRTTANQYAVGYSDAENLNNFNSTLGDAASFAAQANASADGVSAPLPSSTTDAAYYIRAAMGQTGFSGPRPQTVTLQAASSTGPSAPSQSSDEWAQCGTTVYFPPTCTATTATTQLNTGVVTGATLTPGNIIRTTAAAGASMPVGHYLVLSSDAGLNQTTLVATSAAALTTVTASVAIAPYVNTATSTQFTVSAFNTTTGEFTSSVRLELNDVVIFSSVTGTTWAANTTYFVNSVTANGFTLANSLGGATLTSGTITGTSTAIYWRTVTSPVLFINNGGPATTLTARNALSGTAVAHGLSVGDVLVFQSGTISAPAGVSTGDGLVVKEVVSQSEFKLGTSISGDAVAITAAGGVTFYPIRQMRVLPIQIDKTTRQWIRLTHQNFNGGTAQTGHLAVLYADICPGRDGSYVLR